jgi:hypothetical protein
MNIYEFFNADFILGRTPEVANNMAEAEHGDAAQVA